MPSEKIRSENKEDEAHFSGTQAVSLPPPAVGDSTVDPEKAHGVEESQAHFTKHEDVHDPNEVDWDGPDDPDNPRNWSAPRRAMLVGVITSVVFSTNIAAVAIAPAIPLVLKDFGSDNQELGILAISIEFLGTGVGPVFMGPMSEVVGRRIIYNCANLAFCGLTIGCALAPTLPGLVVLRFLQGCAASCNLNNAGGTIADLVSIRHRGFAMSMYSAGFLLSPVVGPLIGSFLSAAAGWRWVFWLLSISSGTMGLLCAITYPETYAPVLLERKAKRLRSETKSPDPYAKGQRQLTLSALLKRAISRPFRMLLFCPVVTGLAVYNSVVYGTVYLLLSTFSDVFLNQYHYSQSGLGVAYIGLTLGFLISMIIASITNDREHARLVKKHGVAKPEYRLEPLMYGAIAIPVGLFMYGWTAQERVHSAVPIFATGIIGFGVMFTFIPFNVYMIDAYTKYAASAIAAGNILRSMTTATLPLAGIPIYNTLGYGWGNSLLAFISLGLGALAMLFRKYGEQWRERFKCDFD